MQIKRNEPLQAYNSLALRALAAALVRVGSNSELRQACQWAAAQGLPVVPLGEGSNIVLAGDLEALVVCQSARGRQLLEDGPDAVVLRIGAGENWHELVAWCVQQGFYGLENLALIPGTVGAAPIQNIGAYGVELETFVIAVHALVIEDGHAVTLDNAACEFGYRDSVFKHRLRDTLVITAVDLRLRRQPDPRIDYPALAGHLADKNPATVTPADVFRAVVEIRREKLPDPAVEPNAGSFFKNPVLARSRGLELAGQFPGLPMYDHGEDRVKLPAAWLIDHCGWKGYCADGVGIHSEHALVIVNCGADSGQRVLALASEVAGSVADTFGIRLEMEPRIYGQVA